MLNKLFKRSPACSPSREIEKITSFNKSNALLTKALDIIPIASQTFSKSHLQYPKDHAPLFIDRGQGARVWDIDGNSYIDMVNGLMSITLGYNDPDVNSAVMKQLSRGITFSHASELEYELAEMLVDIIPCADMVRYGKTGTDATSACIRLSRAYTGRDKILACGYHGWQDWYIGTTARRLGVPKAVQALTDTVAYNDLDALSDLLKTEQYAAFILEPMNIAYPKPGYLEAVREITRQTGTILVFDEIVTGFHFALGGAQELFGVTPDLAAFGKGMGNGLPISAVVGSRHIMKKMDDIFFSGTFGGETLSLAGSIAVIQKMKRESVIQHLQQAGERLDQAVSKILKDTHLDHLISFKGHPCWKIMSVENVGNISAQVIKTFIQKNMIARGVIILSTHNMSYAFGNDEHDTVIKAYRETFSELSHHLTQGTLMDNLGCPVIEPIFKVR